MVFWIRKSDPGEEPDSLVNAKLTGGRVVHTRIATSAITTLKIDIFWFIAECVVLSEDQAFSERDKRKYT